MRRLLHISDLHFGREDTRVVEALRATARCLEPHVIAVSGDLTQRAKAREFIAARHFLDSLSTPRVVVPGNHDIPLYRVWSRFLAPLDNYRRYFGAETDSLFIDREIAVVGVNTARSLTFKGGRINAEQVERARSVFCDDENKRVRILVTHHPFCFPGKVGDDDLVGRAHMALRQLRDCMPDVLVAGHLHAHEIGTTARRFDLGGRSAIVVQAGTATSTRVRGEENSFNLLDVEHDTVAVRRYRWNSSDGVFDAGMARRYARQGLQWAPSEAGP